MSRAFCIPGVLFLLCALVLSFLVSISLPFLPAIDIARVHFSASGVTSSGSDTITESRLGIWAHCEYRSNGDKICSETGHGYAVGYHLQNNNILIGPSWTRGLAVHPIVTAVTFVAFLLSFSTHVTITLISSLTSFLAALLALIAFAIDIALYAYLKHQVEKLSGAGSTSTPPGFWMTFATLILLLLAGCTVCFGRRRRERGSGASSYPVVTSTTTRRPFWRRFRRNRY